MHLPSRRRFLATAAGAAAGNRRPRPPRRPRVRGPRRTPPSVRPLRLPGRPSLVVRDTHLGPGIDTVAPYADMSAAFPWQEQRFAEYRNTGPGAAITVPASRPQLTPEQAESATRAAYLGDWEPWKKVA